VKLTLLKGTSEASDLLQRQDPLDMDAISSTVIQRTEEVFGAGVSPAQSVVKIIEEVRQNGDEAVLKYARMFDDPDISSTSYDLSLLDQAESQIPKKLWNSLELAAERIRDFHSKTMPKMEIKTSAGISEIVKPLQNIGVYVPGGTAAYPSTVLMTVIPAKIAGCESVCMVTPKLAGRDMNPVVLAAAKLAGVDAVYQVGGVPSIAALAYGTETIPKVDKICGPGNVLVAYAKKMVQGQVDIDGIFGPTETIVIADKSASAEFCAADMIAQAEHDPMATAILITDDCNLIGEVENALDSQLSQHDRGELARQALLTRGKIVLVENLAEGIEIANSVAPEHLCLMVENTAYWKTQVKNAGGLFLGEYSPEVMGDYVAGPSHVMPTGGTARFSSALSVHHFLKTMPVVELTSKEFGALAPDAVNIAQAEGLTAHSNALSIRLDNLSKNVQKGSV
tara:strand:- start:2207 stop:3562 length:1356 start_codon:yes stop_codon:yes gene_type:complete